MKFLSLILLLLSIATGFCQEQELTPEDVKRLEEEINNQSNKLRRSLLQKNYDSELQKDILVSFSVDTFLIERMLEQKLQLEPYTMSMVEAEREAEAKYDKLLNKYYQRLLNQLNETDKNTLRLAQKAWLQFRDRERALNGLLTNDVYSGGGTMYYVIEAQKFRMITSQRVFEIVSYLARINR